LRYLAYRSGLLMERHSVFDRLRRTVIGSPLPTSASHEERYSNAEALAILSSDALANLRGVSSSAKLLSLPTSTRWNTARTATVSVWLFCRSL
jgi:hypothetical protein